MKRLNLKKKVVSVLTDKEKANIQGGGTNETCASFATEIRWTEQPCGVPVTRLECPSIKVACVTHLVCPTTTLEEM
ncbi:MULTISPECIES: hypothetical protein [Flavobacterium]|uniref:hypothetical protein n=1 Tax=Flavobacterium TaxID=237 RepID=UPI00095DE58B|nr:MULTISPECIES: hypothetical protein [Flavobacterium]MBN9285734.1 hypothetical protein [Flavobacterium sp.]OJV70621.1 MAG: hypothetical protein BGO42_08585 [Flavobacterium sp. 40-81]